MSNQGSGHTIISVCAQSTRICDFSMASPFENASVTTNKLVSFVNKILKNTT